MQSKPPDHSDSHVSSASPALSSLSSTRSMSTTLLQKLNGARAKATSKILGIRRGKSQTESPRNSTAVKRVSQASSQRNLTGDDLYSRRPDLVLGTLDVALVKGKDLQAKDPFVEIHLESHRRRSSHAAVDKSSGTVEWSDARWTLDVTDLASDLHVVLFASHQFRTPQPLGRVIVPLPTLIEDSWSGHAKAAERSWFEVYPITTKIEQKAGCKETQEFYSCKKYLTAVPKWPGSGMARPTKSIGFICLELGLHLNESAWEAMLRSRPWWQIGPTRALSMGSEDDNDDDEDNISIDDASNGGKSSANSQEQILRAEYEFEANPSTMYVIPRLSEVQGDMALWALLRNFRFLLKRNKMRVRRLKTMAPLLSYFFSAHGPLAILLIIWAYTSLLAPRPLWPWILLGLLSVNGMMSARDWEFRQRDAYVVWESDVDPKENADVRLRRMLVMLTKINIKVHRCLNVIERIPTAWNWSDPLVSRLAYIIAIPTCLVASLILAFIPLHVTVFIIGTAVILKVFKRQERKRRNAVARLALERERRRSSVDLDSEDSDLEAFDDSPIHRERTADLAGRSGGMGRHIRRGASMVRNFFWMIPDDYELGHRYVAMTQRVGVGGAAKKVSTEFSINQPQL
ncbi:hypothetical protein FOL47_001326 [Perkinsus chesapeaki]|uniref:C2 domain-containing protein n=1 Tax=Perkinsus chesapeaki TaxID=330153 RepID=A0A7J6MJD9_PERCH|nr:hypothetical protein FOL47_001326 [Perkinsus chesapeaki]